MDDDSEGAGYMKMNETEIGEAIRALMMNFLAGNIHTAMPGKVVAYNSSNRTADVKPLIKKSNTDGSQTEYPVLPDVPVAIYGTAGAAVVLPISEGDFVLLVFSERAIDRVMKNGKVNNTSQNRMFHLSDAVAFPGIFPRTSSTSPTLSSLGSDDITIYNNGGKINLIGENGIITPLSGVVTGECIDPFTGNVHADKSGSVYAGK